jgi:hypothetical protein
MAISSQLAYADVKGYWRDAGGRSQCVRGGRGGRLFLSCRQQCRRPALSAERVGRVRDENGFVDAHGA